MCFAVLHYYVYCIFFLLQLEDDSYIQDMNISVSLRLIRVLPFTHDKFCPASLGMGGGGGGGHPELHRYTVIDHTHYLAHSYRRSTIFHCHLIFVGRGENEN